MSRSRTRRATGVLVCCLLALAGCGLPPGVDGDLTNNWSAFPPPEVPVPTVGQCLNGDILSGGQEGSHRVPVDCARAHDLEVVYVGRFSGAAAAAPAPPAQDSPDARAAFAECDRAAGDYLGGDWHDSRMFLHYAAPTATQWRAGARFFSCFVYEVAGINGNRRNGAGSAKGGLSGDRPLARRCFDQQGAIGADGYYAADDDAVFVDCAQEHTLEYAGKFVPPDGPYPATGEALNPVIFPGCGRVVGDFLGLSVTALDRRDDLNTMATVPTENEWRLGDRAVGCYVAVPATHAVHGSLKLLGGRPLPS